MAAGWPGHAQNTENAGPLLQQVPKRKNAWQGAEAQAGCPGPPPHLPARQRVEALAWGGPG